MTEKVIFVDPVGRIEGHLGVRAVVDTTTRRVKEAWTVAAMFRGFEVFLRGRPPEDAVFITSRICGVCAASHANASVLAVDMAYGVTPEPLGVALRALAFVMTDYAYDHPTILNMLEGPDYSEAIVSKLVPSCWEEAKRAKAEHADIHGYSTIADIMKDLNPITGRIWRMTVKYQRYAKEAGVLIYGKYGHPNALIPGGIMTDVSRIEYLLQDYVFRLVKLTAWAKFVLAVWDDLANFMIERCGYELQGRTHDPPVMLCSGLFDDPEAYSEIGSRFDPVEVYRRIDEATSRRYERPGLAVGAELVTKSLKEVNIGSVEFVDSGFYADWKEVGLPIFTETDPEGNKLVWGMGDLIPYHMWNKTTIPKPVKTDWAGKYTWAGEPRIVLKDGRIVPVEVGPIARLWVQSLYGKVEITLPRSVDEDLPRGTWEELTFEWRRPRYSTTMERLRARAYHLALVIQAGWHYALKALELVRAGHLKTSRPWNFGKYPDYSLGFGFWEAPRGSVRHWVIQRGGRIVNYQIHAPTTKNVSPRNRRCRGPHEGQCTGPYEMAVRNTVVTEELPPDEWTGLDFVRAVRSFDPCLACTVHIEVPGRSIRRLISPACPT